MKKLLAILAALSLSTTGVITVVGCKTSEREGIDISLIEKNLIFLLQTKPENDEPWAKGALEETIVNKEIDKAGGISVEVGEPISPGTVTEFEQIITFKGNANSKNAFIYSGQVTVTYAYGKNLPPAKVQITNEGVAASFASLEEFLVGTTFNNKDLVNKTFKSEMNIPGAPVEGLRFGVVKNLVIEPVPSFNSKDENNLPRPTLKFSFEANADLKDKEVYKFEDNFDNEFHEFVGQVFAPIIIEQAKIDELIEQVSNDAKESNFFNEEDFGNQIKSHVESLSLKEGIQFESFQTQEILADNPNNEIAWLGKIKIMIKPNSALGYEFPKDAKSLQFNIVTNFISLMKITDATLTWNLFEKSERMIIAPQFINFGKADKKIQKIQGDYLIDRQISSKWGDENTDPAGGEASDDPWISEKGSVSAHQQKQSLAMQVLQVEEQNKQTEEFINKYLKYTTSFNYQKSDDLFINDKALFFNEDDKNWQDNLQTKLNKKASLAELQKDTLIIDNTTITAPKYFHMILLSKESDGMYQTSSKAFRVRLNFNKI